MEWIIGILVSLLSIVGAAFAAYRKGRRDESTADALARAAREYRRRSEITSAIQTAAHDEIAAEAKNRAEAEEKHRQIELERARLEKGAQTADLGSFDRELKDLEEYVERVRSDAKDDEEEDTTP